jgi:hypothetical protein
MVPAEFGSAKTISCPLDGGVDSHLHSSRPHDSAGSVFACSNTILVRSVHSRPLEKSARPRSARHLRSENAYSRFGLRIRQWPPPIPIEINDAEFEI